MATPIRGQPATSVLVPLTTQLSSNSTKLAISLYFSNGTRITTAEVFAGSLKSQLLKQEYVFQNIDPGNYQLNITGLPHTYVPSTIVKVVSGINSLNLTVYQLDVFEIFETPNLSLNGSQPGPAILVKNATAVKIIIHNNTTLIHNLAVVATLYDTNYSNILFNSLSNTITAGGSVNDTFIATRRNVFLRMFDWKSCPGRGVWPICCRVRYLPLWTKKLTRNRRKITIANLLFSNEIALHY